MESLEGYIANISLGGMRAICPSVPLEVRDAQRRMTIDRVGVPQQRDIEPLAAPRSAGYRIVFLADSRFLAVIPTSLVFTATRPRPPDLFARSRQWLRNRVL